MHAIASALPLPFLCTHALHEMARERGDFIGMILFCVVGGMDLLSRFFDFCSHALQEIEVTAKVAIFSALSSFRRNSI